MSPDRFFSVFKTAARGLSVQRRQISLASQNIANAYTTRRTDGPGPYRPKTLQVSVDGDQRFQQTLQDTLVEMQTTNGNHIAEPQTHRVGGGPADLGPRADVVEQQKFRYEYDPDHPDADSNGMVKYPDVDMVQEMTRMVSANRLYEANLSVIQAEKSIIKNAFKI